MATYMEMSLEDIIKKKRKQSTPRNLNNPQQNAIVDARQKIISKKRTQISDARDILADLAKQKDARLKLQQLRAKKQNQGANKRQSGNIVKHQGKPGATFKRRERVFTDPSRQVTSQPAANANWNLNFRKPRNQFIQNHAFKANMSSIKPITRTVKNDLQIIDEPMEEEYTPPQIKQIHSNRHTSLQLKIIAHNSDVPSRTPIVHRIAVEKEKSPPRPPSILKKRPMAALRGDEKMDKTEKQIVEYRIIVSNLRNTVTSGDIEELFGDVGGMLESRLVRPGTAEVIYKGLEDAQRAVDLYHNRQLDGQPMNCLLVAPRSPSAHSTNVNTKPHSGSSIVEPDISTFHKVLFSTF